ncbi:MAG: ribbon-helix-helix protein, CopG family [Rhodocyclaceae bacterium]
MRVNARLDDAYQAKIDYLTEIRHTTVSDVVRDAIDHYYEAVKAERARKRCSLDDLVGMFEGRPDTPPDLSTNYKKYIGEIIEAKYPQHGSR